jgi:hypothetical protein
MAAVILHSVYGANVRVIQGRSGASFQEKTIECGLIASELRWEELERDTATEREILRFVDDAHAPAAELTRDAVVRDGLVDHWREMLRLLTGQVNQSGGVGSVSKGLLLKYRDFTH